MTPQPGIFALGTSAQCFLEFARREGVSTSAVVGAFADLEEPGASVGGVNFVVGFRPELWAEVGSPPEGARGFTEPVRGPDGFTMPATQRDVWLWISGASQDIVFDVAVAMIEAVAGVATVVDEVTGWPYQRIRDLTGFIDGTENPPLSQAPEVVLETGTDSTVVLVQKWQHRSDEWRLLSDEQQALVMGRTKRDSAELDSAEQPADSHVSRTVVEADGQELKILRRNTPYGGVTEHGTMFVGFCARQAVMELMLDRMAGIGDGIRDALTRFADPLTGAYYVVPSLETVRSLATPDPD